MDIENMSTESIKNYLKHERQEYYEIPDNIKLNISGNIIFNNRKSLLQARSKNGYNVYTDDFKQNSFTSGFVLVPCKRKDLKNGDTAYFGSCDNTYNHFGDLIYYCKILNNKEYICVGGDRYVSVSDTTWDRWYKVVPRSEVEDEEVE